MPGAVTGVGFAGQTAPRWSRLTRNLEGVRHQLMGFFSLHVDDESESAGVVLKLRIIQPLFQRRTKRRLSVIISVRHCILVNAGEYDCVRLFFTQI